MLDYIPHKHQIKQYVHLQEFYLVFALKYFESGYQSYRDIEELFKANRRFLCFSSFFGFFCKAFQGIWWVVVTIIISVVAVLIEQFVL